MDTTIMTPVDAVIKPRSRFLVPPIILPQSTLMIRRFYNFAFVYEVFKTYLDNKIFLTEEQHEWIRSQSVVKKLRKKQYLLQEGDHWHYKGFVTKGLLRTYS